MVFWTTFKEDTLLEYKQQLNWKGSGTKSDPLIIDNLGRLNLCIHFKKIRFHIIIRDLTLCECYILQSENIKIEKCEIYYLYIKLCHDLKIEESSIAIINVRTSRGNIFRKNKFTEYNMKHYLSPPKVDKPSNFDIQLLMIMGITLFFGAIFEIFMGLYGLAIFFIIIFAGIIYLIVKLKLKAKKVMKMPPNVFEGNDVDELKFLFDRFEDKYNI